MSRIQREYCSISTSYLVGLSDIFILLHIWQNCVRFGTFLAMRTLRDTYHKEFEFISVQSWAYYLHGKNGVFLHILKRSASKKMPKSRLWFIVWHLWHGLKMLPFENWNLIIWKTVAPEILVMLQSRNDLYRVFALISAITLRNYLNHLFCFCVFFCFSRRVWLAPNPTLSLIPFFYSIKDGKSIPELGDKIHKSSSEKFWSNLKMSHWRRWRVSALLISLDSVFSRFLQSAFSFQNVLNISW